MTSTQSDRRGPLVGGILLVLLGIVLLVGQLPTVHLEWVVWPIVIGIGFLVVAVVVGEPSGRGLAVLGGIITMVGVVLAAQQQADTYVSWAYAWALVAPGGVGVGLAVYGLLTARWAVLREGIGALVAGIALFLIFFVFFEGIIGIGGVRNDDLVTIVAPLAIVGLGVLLLLGAFVMPYLPGRAEADGWPAASGAATGATAPAGGAGPTTSAPEGPRSIELGGAADAEISLTFGAGRLTIAGRAAPGHLLDGTFRGGVRREDQGPGRVRLSTPGERIWDLPWDRAPFEWRLSLTGEVPLRLSLETGAARTEADLSDLRLSDLRVRTGAAESFVTLPRAAGMTRVDAEGGAAALHFRIPDGVAAHVRSKMAIGSTDVDTTRFPPDPAGGWTSRDFATAEHRVELDLRGGVGAISVR